MPSLMVMTSPSNAVHFPVTTERALVIGRDGICDIVLSGRTVSRKHARVFSRGELYFVEDLGSSHGTFVNGDPVHEAVELKDGDHINVHNTPIIFHAQAKKELNDTSTHVMMGTEWQSLPEQSTTQTVARSQSRAKLRPMLPGRLPNLLEISQRLGSSLDIEEIFPRVLDILFEMFPQSSLGEINLVDQSGQLIPVAMKHGRDDDSSILTRVPVGNDLAHRVLQLGQPVFRTYEESANESVLDEDSAMICVPMLGPSQAKLGTILLETQGTGSSFDEEDLELVALVGIVAGQAIEYAQAHTKLLRLDQTQRQLAMARQIQLRMLPRERPQVPGYQFDAYYSAAETVGGDYFFWDLLQDSHVAVAVADACGKGLPGALMVAQFATEIRHCIATAPTLKTAISQVNRFVCRLGEGFVTFCLCLMNINQHTLTIVNAGHPMPFCRRHRSNIVEVLQGTKPSFPLGIDPKTEYHPFTIPIESGDEVFVWTDGIHEAMAPDGSLFGITRLQRVIAAPQIDLKSRIKSIVTNLETFRAGRAPSDDTCLVGIARDITPPTNL